MDNRNSSERPRSVDAAFWCWMLAAVLLVVGGLMAAFAGLSEMPDNFPGASLSADEARSVAFIYRGAGVIYIASGLGIAYLAVGTRKRNSRYRRIAVALSLAVLLVAILFGFLFGMVLLLPLLALIALIAGAVLATRKTSAAWFQSGDDDGDLNLFAPPPK